MVRHKNGFSPVCNCICSAYNIMAVHKNGFSPVCNFIWTAYNIMAFHKNDFSPVCNFIWSAYNIMVKIISKNVRTLPGHRSRTYAVKSSPAAKTRWGCMSRHVTEQKNCVQTHSRSWREICDNWCPSLLYPDMSMINNSVHFIHSVSDHVRIFWHNICIAYIYIDTPHLYVCISDTMNEHKIMSGHVQDKKCRGGVRTVHLVI